MYLYRKPSIFLPFGPSPVVVTLGIFLITPISPSRMQPLESLAFLIGFSDLVSSDLSLTECPLDVVSKVITGSAFIVLENDLQSFGPFGVPAPSGPAFNLCNLVLVSFWQSYQKMAKKVCDSGQENKK